MRSDIAVIDTNANSEASRKQRLLRASRIACWSAGLFTYVIQAIWFTLHKPTLSSDDALFFMHSLTRFSVLDFSPQFPGYPGFVAMGRLALLIVPDPLHALATLTTSIALALPPMAALVAWRTTNSSWPCLVAFAVTMACPLLPDMALSLLSDGSGILFLLLFLAALPSRSDQAFWRLRGVLAGAALGWALACRPSDAALLGGSVVGAIIAIPRLTIPLLLGGLVIVVPVGVVVFALEGYPYIEEGLRFFSGHTLIWGNTAFASAERHGGWLLTLGSFPGGRTMAALLVVGWAWSAWLFLKKALPIPSAILGALLLHTIWIVAFQNPDHLRHLAPIMILGGLLLALMPGVRVRAAACLPVAVYLATEIYAVGTTTDLSVTVPSPLAAAATFLAARPNAVVATNEDVFALRALLPQTRVYDMHYPADAALGQAMATGGGFRLTTTKPSDDKVIKTFVARYVGEQTSWLERP